MFISNVPLKFKLMTVIFFVAVLISAVSVIGFRMVLTQANNMIYSQTASSMAVLSDKISGRLENIMEVSLVAAVNRNIQDNLKIVNAEESSIVRFNARARISESVHGLVHRDIINISILPAGDEALIWGFDSTPEDERVFAAALLAAREAQGAPVWFLTGRADGSLLCVREIRSVGRPFLEHLGYLVIRVNFDRIVREASRDILAVPAYQINIYKNDMLLYPAAALYEDRLPRREDDYSQYFFSIRDVDGEALFLVYSPVDIAGHNWEFVLGLPYGHMFRAQAAANTYYFVSLAAAVLIAAVMSFFIFSGINSHIKLLEKKMDRIREGNLEPLNSNLRLADDELGRLNLYFDEMREEFKQAIEDNYVKELLLTQTQLSALEQQMNPHFLYNSLDAVHWFARRGDGESITAIVSSLGSLLRNTLSVYEDMISLKKEMEILDSYLCIQRIRFPDTLFVNIDIEDDAYDVLIPKMSIQPLVENAIMHSMEENIGMCNIEVRAKLTDGHIKVEVENDGSEIQEDILSLLQQKKLKSRGSGIGLINIDTRIKLLFGQNYGLHFKSGENCVVVSYELPVVKEVNHAKASDSG